MERFLTTLCNTNNLDSVTVIKEWQDFNELNTKYNKMKKSELVDICSSRGFKSKGSKTDLISYIFDEVKEDVKKIPVKKQTKMSPGTKKNIIDKLKKDAPTVVIRRNDHGNYEHSDTRLIFDTITKNVIGKQLNDGSVIDISKEDIESCKKYNFNYNTPSMLDVGSTDLDKKDDIADLLDEDAMVDEDSDSDIEY